MCADYNFLQSFHNKKSGKGIKKNKDINNSKEDRENSGFNDNNDNVVNTKNNESNSNKSLYVTALPLAVTFLFLLTIAIISFTETMEISKEFINVKDFVYSWSIISVILLATLIITAIFVFRFRVKKHSHTETEYIINYSGFCCAFFFLIIAVTALSAIYVADSKFVTYSDLENAILSDEMKTPQTTASLTLQAIRFKDIFIFVSLGVTLLLLNMIKTILSLFRIKNS